MQDRADIRPSDDGSGHLLPPAPRDGEAAPVVSPSAPMTIEWAADRVVSGGVIAIPTDTVYGLIASLSHPEALERIYQAKGRPADKVLPVLVSSVQALERLVPGIDRRVALVLDEFWPGPLTIVIPAGPLLPAQVLAPDGTVGVRLPNHPLAIEIIERAGGAVASTSANRSGEPPALTAAQVSRDLGEQIDLVVDGGVAPGGVPSTVVALREHGIEVLREGAISVSQIAESWARTGNPA